MPFHQDYDRLSTVSYDNTSEQQNECGDEEPSEFHYGVSCGVCDREIIDRIRYRCLVCFDYELCYTCYNAFAVSHQHTNKHEMEQFEEPTWNEDTGAPFVGTILTPETGRNPPDRWSQEKQQRPHG